MLRKVRLLFWSEYLSLFSLDRIFFHDGCVGLLVQLSWGFFTTMLIRMNRKRYALCSVIPGMLMAIITFLSWLRKGCEYLSVQAAIFTFLIGLFGHVAYVYKHFQEME